MKCYLRPNMDFVEALILCKNMDNIKECKKCGNPNFDTTLFTYYES